MYIFQEIYWVASQKLVKLLDAVEEVLEQLARKAEDTVISQRKSMWRLVQFQGPAIPKQI